MSNLHIFTGLTPAVLDADGIDNSPGVTLGVNWYSEQDGVVYGTRFYLGNRKYDGQQITGGLFNADSGELVVQKTITVTSAMAIGWQNIEYDVPYLVARNQEYIAAVYFPCDTSFDGKGHYTFTGNFFIGNNGYDRPPLHAQKNDMILDRRNGLFRYGDSSIKFPSNNYQGGNYFIDIDFNYYVKMPVYNATAGKWQSHPIKHRQNGTWKY
jgi:hypothetical protein